jgi:hypothetical protein
MSKDEATNIVQLETTFRGRALVWYMKLQSTTPTGQARTLDRNSTRIIERVQEVEV